MIYIYTFLNYGKQFDCTLNILHVFNDNLAKSLQLNINILLCKNITISTKKIIISPYSYKHCQLYISL